MRRTRELRILTHIAAQVQNVDRVEVVGEMFAHPVKRHTIEKSIVGHESDNPVVANSICCPSDRLYICIGKFVLVRRFGRFCVCLRDPLVYHRVFTVLVIVVLVDLPHVVGRIADHHEHGRLPLALDALRVLGRKHRHLPVLGQLEGVDEADAREGLINAGGVVVLVLNVHAGDVVGQQHDLVAVQLPLVLALERGTRDRAHHAHDEVAGADEGVDDVHALVGEGAAELALEDGGHAAHHEVDDRLRGVDDAVRVGDLDGKTLEELFVDGVEEVLFLGEVADGGGGALDGGVEAVQLAQEIGAAERLGGERVDYAFNLACDDVAVGKVRVVEDGAEEALGEQVLDQHLLDGGFGEIGVDGLAAFVQKGGEGGGESLVGLALLLDQLGQALADVGDPVLELGDGLFPGGVFLGTVGEEGVEGLDEPGGVGEVVVESMRPFCHRIARWGV